MGFVFAPFAGAVIATGFTFRFGFAGATGFLLGFGTGFLDATGLALVGTAFVDAGRFVFGARFVDATSFVFGFGFAPLTGFGVTGFPFVFVARLFDRGAAIDFGCAALAGRS